MYSFVLMAALTTGGNAPDYYWVGYYPAYYYSYPAYYYPYSSWYAGWYYPGWYYPYYSWGWPGYCGCGPVTYVAPGAAADGAAGKGDGAAGQDRKKGGKKIPLQEGFGTEKKKTSSLGNKALLVVKLPADAKLFIDDHPTVSVSSMRKIVTPALNPGQTYYYRVRAELARNGQTLTETQEVLLRPGEAAHARFADLETRAASLTETARR